MKAAPAKAAANTATSRPGEGSGEDGDKNAAQAKTAATKPESSWKRAPKKVAPEVLETETAVVAATPKPVFNATPINLTLWRERHPGAAAAVERATMDGVPPATTLELRPTHWPSDFDASGRIVREGGEDELVITPANLTLVWQEDPPEVGVVLSNDTDGYIDVYTVDDKGTASLVAGGIACEAPRGTAASASPVRCSSPARRSRVRCSA